MSSSSSWTEYTFDIDLSGQSENSQFTLISQQGMTDALAFELLAALNGISWPTGTTVTLSKVTRSEVDYVTDLTATPPVFT